MTLKEKLQAAEAILHDLVDSVETVGVDAVYHDMGWFDLYSIYRDSCVALGREPMVHDALDGDDLELGLDEDALYTLDNDEDEDN